MSQTNPNNSSNILSTLKWFLLLIPAAIGFLILHRYSANMDIIPIFLISFCLILSPLVLFIGFLIHTVLSFLEQKLKDIAPKKS
jgi:uncharacterized membrane protein